MFLTKRVDAKRDKIENHDATRTFFSSLQSPLQSPLRDLAQTLAAMVDNNYNTIQVTHYGTPSAYPAKWQPRLLDRAKGAKLWMFVTVMAVLAYAYFSLSFLDAEEDILPPRPQVAFRFMENRERLYGLLVEAVPEFSQVDSKVRRGTANRSVVLIPASRRYARGESDMEYGGWRQSSNVIYVLGEYNIAESLVVLSAKVGDRGVKGSMNVDVFLPQLNQREVVFLGPHPSPEVLQRENKVSGVYEINTGFAEAFEPGTSILTTVPEEAILSLLGEETIRKALAKNIRFEYREAVKEAFVESRFVKSENELKLLKYASQVSAKAHQETESYLQHNHRVSEIELASFFAHRCLIRGSRLQAYPPIVGAGKHAAILHYRTGENTTSGYSPIPKKAFVLIDAAGEYQGYASDITRTISRTKHRSKEMKEVYEIVKTVQDTVLKSYDVGKSWLELTQLASKTTVEELLRHKFIHGDLKTLLESGVQSVFMPHGLGHPVGLDVHDPTPAKYEIRDKSSTFGISPFLKQFLISSTSARVSTIPAVSDYKIFPGHITTVEPGVYFVPMLLDMVKGDPDGPGRYINWSKLQSGNYRELGGVRIEDVVMINTDGKKEIISRS